MKNSMITALRAGAAPLVLGFAMASAPAFAQDTTAQDTTAPDATADDVPVEAIIVTGSRIKQPNLEAANPVAVVTGEDLFKTGNLSVGDQLNQLPQVTPSFGQQNSGRFLGTSGLNLIDLRGLGTQRTLVLQNGRRHVAGDILNTGTSVDINTIPTDLIDRIDIVTGGASSVYGSDAIAGVVNFILKDHYDGIQVRGQTGLSTYGDAGNQYVSLLAGQNFSEGRGNIAVNLEYSHQDDYYGSGRPNIRQNDTFVITQIDPPGAVNGSDGVPDRTFLRDVRFASLSLGGLVAVFPNSTTEGPCGAGGGRAFTCSYLFQPGGTLVPQDGTRVGVGPNGNFIGGNGMSGREGKQLVLSPDLTRYSANLVGHFDVSDAFVPFIEATYARTEVSGSQQGPFFSQGATLGDPFGRERVRLDNPYLNPAASAFLTQQFAGNTVNANTGNAFQDILDDDDNVVQSAAEQLAAQQAAIANGSFRFGLRRNWLDLGVREEDITRETYRIVGGVRGDFNDDWNYEVSVNYGEFREKNIIKGNVNVQRYLLALDTVQAPNGQIVCRSQIDPAAANAFVVDGDGNPVDAGRLAADIAACVPLNPFGQGSVNSAMRNYLLVDSRAEGKITQFDALAFVSGDSSQLFELPGGPLAFVLGSEYRRETNSYVLDETTQQGYAFYNAIPSLVAPAFEVFEMFGELQVPILKDQPFAEELSLKGSGRMADYKGSAGTVWTYGGEGVWKPIQDITLRGTYSHSVRAPNLTELYSAQGQNFAPGFVDPCSERNLASGSANRAANCTAAGRPAGYDFTYISSLETLLGGNPNLKAETSDSWTLGTLLQPRFIPDLSLSIDYYDITVDNVITTIDAQDIANLCYDSPTLNNPFCDLFQRAGGGGGANGEIPFQILEGTLLASSANFAKLKTRGLDVQLDYSHAFDWGTLSVGALWTHVFQLDQFTDPSDPSFADRLLDELPNPSDKVNFNASAKVGKVTFGYQLRWIDKMYLNTYEDYNSLNGLPPQNEDFAPIVKYPDRFYHDVRVAVDIAEKFNLYFGIDNVTNAKPPYGLTGTGGGTALDDDSGIYDNRGRFLYTGFKANF